MNSLHENCSKTFKLSPCTFYFEILALKRVKNDSKVIRHYVKTTKRISNTIFTIRHRVISMGLRYVTMWCAWIRIRQGLALSVTYPSLCNTENWKCRYDWRSGTHFYIFSYYCVIFVVKCLIYLLLYFYNEYSLIMVEKSLQSLYVTMWKQQNAFPTPFYDTSPCNLYGITIRHYVKTNFWIFATYAKLIN